jgi:hypothetical protein
MSDYDFATLSPYDFECLVRDLLQKELAITLESFTVGKDDGIDLRYHKNIDDKIIIQVKHYYNSNFSILLNHLKSKELAKVKQLNPSRYIFVTSKGLTPRNKDKIMGLFGKYILSTADIYGKNDINNLLGKFPEVEKRSFKLWLTSQAVLEKLLHSEIFNQSDLEMNNIKKKMKYYVENENFINAKKILDEAHYCIITGIPGIGKTTLAEILIIKYLDMGYELVKISKDIAEAYEAYEPKTKQIFYYDDFLGQTSLEEKLTKNEDQRLILFLNDIEKTQNTRFILTTRDYILNKAKSVYEKLDQPCIDIYKYTIDLSSYDDFDKAKILYNHLYFSGISQKYINALLKDKKYWKIIRHENFNPRIVERMTEYIAYLGIDCEDYVNEFLDNLDNPIRLWEHAFSNQISNASKNLLVVLASMNDSTSMTILEQSFISMQKYKFRAYGLHVNADDFRKSLKELDGNFIKTSKWGSDFYISFHNPSIRDFIENYLSKNYSEVMAICNSAKFFDQFIAISKYIKKTELDNYLFQLEKNLYADDSKRMWQNYNSVELRLLSLFKLYDELGDDRIIGLAHHMIDALIERLNTDDGNKEAIVQIVSSLLRMQISYKKEILYEALKSFFLTNLENLSDFNYIISLSKTCPELLSCSELDDLRDQFIDFYQRFVEELEVGYIFEGEYVSEPDQDIIRESIDILDSAKKFFQVDVKRGKEKLDDLSKKIEKTTEEEENVNSNWVNTKLKEDGEIELLFDILRDPQSVS